MNMARMMIRNEVLWAVRRLQLPQQMRLISQKSLQTIHAKEVKKRQRSQGRPSRRDFLGMDGSFEENYKILEGIEEDAEDLRGLGPSPDEQDPTINRSLTRQRHKVQKALVQRKHFRCEGEVNLLSWDAKAQMRYLHTTDPDTWTPQQLAASFPISSEGAAKVVKQQWVPRSIQEVLNHDKRVHRNWLALKACGENGDTEGPLYSRYERMLAAGELHLLGHAAGIPSLPRPAEEKLMAAGGSVVEPVEGRFTAIVKPYYEKSVQTHQETDLQALPDNVTLIESVLSSLGEKEAKAVETKLQATYSSLKAFTKKNGAKSTDGLVNLTSGKTEADKVDNKASQTGRSLRRQAAQEGKQGEEKEFVMDDELHRMRRLRHKTDQRVQLQEFLGSENDRVTDTVGGRRLLATGNMRNNAQPRKENEILSEGGWKDESDAWGIQGTGKVSQERMKTSHSKHQMDASVDFQSKSPEKFQRDLDKVRKLRCDGDEVEVYTSEEGYSYPFSSKNNVAEDLESRCGDKLDRDMRVYRKNEAVYDEDREFLFRSPSK